MGEKGMESPAPLRPGVAGAGELMAPIAGISNMAAGGTLGGSLAGNMQAATGGGLGEAGSNQNQQKQDDDMISRPPTG